MMTKAQRDLNEMPIIDALRLDGNVVHPVSDANGHPDLLVWCWRLKRLRLLEVKNPALPLTARHLTDKQVKFFQRFGSAVEAGDVVKVESIEEALAAVGFT